MKIAALFAGPYDLKQHVINWCPVTSDDATPSFKKRRNVTSDEEEDDEYDEVVVNKKKSDTSHFKSLLDKALAKNAKGFARLVNAFMKKGYSEKRACQHAHDQMREEDIQSFLSLYAWVISNCITLNRNDAHRAVLDTAFNLARTIPAETAAKEAVKKHRKKLDLHDWLDHLEVGKEKDTEADVMKNKGAYEQDTDEEEETHHDEPEQEASDNGEETDDESRADREESPDTEMATDDEDASGEDDADRGSKGKVAATPFQKNDENGDRDKQPRRSTRSRKTAQ